MRTLDSVLQPLLDDFADRSNHVRLLLITSPT